MATPINKHPRAPAIRGRRRNQRQRRSRPAPERRRLASSEIQFRGQTNARLTGTKGPVVGLERRAGRPVRQRSSVIVSAADGVGSSPACPGQKRHPPLRSPDQSRLSLAASIVTPIAWKRLGNKAAGDRQTEQEIEGQTEDRNSPTRTEKRIATSQPIVPQLLSADATEGSRARDCTSTRRLVTCTAAQNSPHLGNFALRLRLRSSPSTGAVMQVHESAINNNGGSFAAATLTSRTSGELVFDTLALTARRTESPARPRSPAKVTLTWRQAARREACKTAAWPSPFDIDSFPSDGRPYAGRAP